MVRCSPVEETVLQALPLQFRINSMTIPKYNFALDKLRNAIVAIILDQPIREVPP